jgi:hypothetical protein
VPNNDAIADLLRRYEGQLARLAWLDEQEADEEGDG